MPLSNKVIKSFQASDEIKAARINTDMPIVKTVHNPTSKEDSEAARLEKYRKQGKALLAEAKQQAETITNEAQSEAAQLQEAAQAAGYEAGFDAGQQAGFEKGFAEGRLQAEKENEQLRAHALELIQEAKAAVQDYKSSVKDEILALAVHMAEKIVNEHIDQASEGVLAIAKPYFYQLDKEEEFVTISVHPNQRELVEEKTAQLATISPGTRFMVLGDPSLENNGIVIESSQAVIDLQIKKQLKSMLREFEEMERTVND